LPASIRDWALGVSAHAKPPQRRGLDFINPWTDLNSYYGDDANKIAFASTITLGALLEDGRVIRIWDTGLPPDLHRGFITPDHGNFLGEKIAQAGSTWLLFGYEKDGTPGLYYRMYDYEMCGACIGMQHSFDETLVQDYVASRVHDPGEAVRKIPVAGWEKIDFPKLIGRAVITDRMSIHSCGEGNEREIRLEGKNPHGSVGYYYKLLSDNSWRFKATSDENVKGSIIRVGTVNREKKNLQPATWNYDADYQLSGLDSMPITNVAILNFHPYQTQAEPSTLRFTLHSKKVVDVLFRTADAWSPFTRTSREDRFVATGASVPKILVGSLDIPPSLYASSDQEISHFVTNYLKPYDRIPNLFEVIADIDGINIATTGVVRHDREGRSKDLLAPWSLSCSRSAILETLFEKQALQPDLVASPDMTADQIKSILEKNIALKDGMLEEHAFFLKSAKKQARRWQAFGSFFSIAKGFIAMASLKQNPYMGAVLDLMPRLIRAHKRAFLGASLKAQVPPGLKRALDRIASNIHIAEALLLRPRFSP
ncbi:MAG TPA: hypothetical protein VEL47_07790, partial [Myxococcota bacterium]|nr:hypothetical protein [Myxococcota bacterium]